MSKVTEINEAAWQSEVAESKTPVLVDFFATWCPPCKVLGSLLENIVDDYDGKVKIVKLNVEQAPRLAMEFGIRAVPTMVFIRDGQTVEVVSGLLRPNDLQARLDKLSTVEA